MTWQMNQTRHMAGQKNQTRHMAGQKTQTRHMAGHMEEDKKLQSGNGGRHEDRRTSRQLDGTKRRTEQDIVDNSTSQG